MRPCAVGRPPRSSLLTMLAKLLPRGSAGLTPRWGSEPDRPGARDGPGRVRLGEAAGIGGGNVGRVLARARVCSAGRQPGHRNWSLPPSSKTPWHLMHRDDPMRSPLVTSDAGDGSAGGSLAPKLGRASIDRTARTLIGPVTAQVQNPVPRLAGAGPLSEVPRPYRKRLPSDADFIAPSVLMASEAPRDDRRGAVGESTPHAKSSTRNRCGQTPYK